MKRIKFFIDSQVQTEADLTDLEDRVNTYMNSLPGITLGPRPHGHLEVQFNFEPNNNSSYSDMVVMVLSEEDDETSQESSA